MRSFAMLTLLALLALSVLAAVLPLSARGPLSSNVRTSLSLGKAALLRHKISKAGMALTHQSPWLLQHLGNAHESGKSAPALGIEDLQVGATVKRSVDASGPRIAGCKGWKEDGLSFWWTLWWDVRRWWRLLRGKPLCDADLHGDGSENVEGGGGKMSDGSEKVGE
ncbi:hypothetical protein MMC11_000945 [Xylographa trunciseda]|nr:hypothetical protein [Xylographa trunciseda]